MTQEAIQAWGRAPEVVVPKMAEAAALGLAIAIAEPILKTGVSFLGNRIKSEAAEKNSFIIQTSATNPLLKGYPTPSQTENRDDPVPETMSVVLNDEVKCLTIAFGTLEQNDSLRQKSSRLFSGPSKYLGASGSVFDQVQETFNIQQIIVFAEYELVSNRSQLVKSDDRFPMPLSNELTFVPISGYFAERETLETLGIKGLFPTISVVVSNQSGELTKAWSLDEAIRHSNAVSNRSGVWYRRSVTGGESGLYPSSEHFFQLRSVPSTASANIEIPSLAGLDAVAVETFDKLKAIHADRDKKRIQECQKYASAEQFLSRPYSEVAIDVADTDGTAELSVRAALIALKVASEPMVAAAQAKYDALRVSAETNPQGTKIEAVRAAKLALESQVKIANSKYQLAALEEQKSVAEDHLRYNCADAINQQGELVIEDVAAPQLPLADELAINAALSHSTSGLEDISATLLAGFVKPQDDFRLRLGEAITGAADDIVKNTSALIRERLSEDEEADAVNKATADSQIATTVLGAIVEFEQAKTNDLLNPSGVNELVGKQKLRAANDQCFIAELQDVDIPECEALPSSYP